MSKQQQIIALVEQGVEKVLELQKQLEQSKESLNKTAKTHNFAIDWRTGDIKPIGK